MHKKRKNRRKQTNESNKNPTVNCKQPEKSEKFAVKIDLNKFCKLDVRAMSNFRLNRGIEAEITTSSRTNPNFWSTSMRYSQKKNGKVQTRSRVRANPQ